MVFVDMNEFIIPAIEGLDNFERMMNYLDENFKREGNKTVGEYRFRCAFFMRRVGRVVGKKAGVF